MSNIISSITESDLIKYFPNVILPAIKDTLIMVIVCGILSIFFGLIIGILLYVTSEIGLKPNKRINTFLGSITDIIRSFPTLVLIVALVPITRMLLGTIVGVPAAIFTLTIGCTPFVARMTENSLMNIDLELIKASKVLGASNLQIITDVLLVEALPSLISNYTTMLINLLSMSAMAGAVGAGGLGAVALTYGYQRFDYPIMYFIVILLIAIVWVIQKVGKIIYRKVRYQ